MNNKVVFITGSASGIGFEMAKQFSHEGAVVVVSDLKNDQIERAVALLQATNANTWGILCDVTREEDVQTAVNKTLEKHGRIDVLINNAGLQYISSIEEFPVQQFEQMIKVMLIGPFVTTKYVLPSMKKQNFGRIINMASVNGLVGFANKAAYNSAKHGLIGLTKVTALEAVSYDITVNALCPGYVDTPLVRNQLAGLAESRNVSLDNVLEQVVYPLVPQKRLLQVQEVSNYALFLASDKSRGITGQAVVIDGGYTAQ